jgi:hypothetical protein
MATKATSPIAGVAGLAVVTFIAGFIAVGMMGKPRPSLPTPVNVVTGDTGASSDRPYDELTAIQMAEFLCKLSDATGLSSAPCSTNYHTIKMSFDLSVGDARQVCTDLAELSKAKKLHFDHQWRIEIHSPYSSGPMAWCVLP